MLTLHASISLSIHEPPHCTDEEASILVSVFEVWPARLGWIIKLITIFTIVGVAHFTAS